MAIEFALHQRTRGLDSRHAPDAPGAEANKLTDFHYLLSDALYIIMHFSEMIEPRLACARVTYIADIPSVFLVEHDIELRSALADGLRFDGMNIVEFHGSAEALAAITEGARPAVLVIASEGDGLITCEHVRQAKAASPRTQIVLLLEPCGDPKIPPGSHVLVKPFTPSKLSRFIRLAVAKPALRSTLQALYRRAHSAPARATP